jgi:aspartyl protease family protein
MLFIGFAIVIAIGLALLISSDAGSMVGLTEQQFGQLVPLVIILVIVAGGLFSRSYKAKELVGNLFAWAAVFVIALVGYAYRDDLSDVASRVYGELVPGTPQILGEAGTVSFRSGFDGHFKINARINGAEVHTIFDTGASAVVLTQADAKLIGLSPEVLSYSVKVSTANGTGRAALVTLDEIDVGGIVRHNVRAFVAEKGALDTSLLGMTFLSTLTRYAVTGNALELSN